jgi:hypothetical protein
MLIQHSMDIYACQCWFEVFELREWNTHTNAAHYIRHRSVVRTSYEVLHFGLTKFAAFSRVESSFVSYATWSKIRIVETLQSPARRLGGLWWSSLVSLRCFMLFLG